MPPRAPRLASGCRELDRTRVRGAHADADTLPAERADVEIGAALARPRRAAGAAPGGTGDHRRQNAHQPESRVGASEAGGNRAVPEGPVASAGRLVRLAGIGHLVDQRQDAVAVAARVLPGA